MHLIDTNIFLEILLEQEKADDCEKLLQKINLSSEKFYVSSFSMHSIEVIMWRNDKKEELKNFLSDILVSRIIRVDTSTIDEIDSIINPEKKLDFDDSLQYALCKKMNLKIISYDKHFDKTGITRVEPKDINLK